MTSLPQVVRLLRRAGTIAVAGHVNPDGDSLGSLLALGLALKKAGKKVVLICQDRVPRNYRRLPGAKLLRRPNGRRVDLAVAVDCGSVRLLGSAGETFRRAGGTLSIDHHQFRQDFARFRFIDTRAAATGELVYRIIRALNVSLDRSISTNILTSLIVETNAFRLPSTRSGTFAICAELVAAGVDYYQVSQMTYWSRTKPVLKLFNAFYSKLRFSCRDRIAWAWITRDDFRRTGTVMEAADPLIEELRSLERTRIAILFRDRHDHSVRVGFRSKGKINVAALAEEYGGGGHYDMAGCVVPRKRSVLKEIISKAEKLLKKS
jgi:phosphoesterase RecJ-like protein